VGEMPSLMFWNFADTGLKDQNGTPRESYHLWIQYMEKEKQ